MIQLYVDFRVHIAVVDLDVATLDEIKVAFTHDNPQHFKLKGMGYKAYKEPATIRTWEIRDGVLSLPRGGFKRVRAILRQRGYEYTVVDNRIKGDSHFTGQIPDYQGPYELRDYQKEAVVAMKEKQNTIIRSATGSGKTSALLAFAALIKLPTLVIVWQGPLYEQWIRRIREELKMPTASIGEIRGGIRKFGPITVAMQQSLWNRLTPEIVNYPGVLIVDECHRAAAKTLREVVDAFPAYYRVGASDDERRTDQKEFLIYDAFGQPSKDIPYNHLADQGHIIDVDIIVVPTEFGPSREYFTDSDFNTLLDEMTVDQKRNDLIMQIIGVASGLGEQVFVMSHRVQHCVDLVTMARNNGIKAGLLVGDIRYKKEFAQTLVEMELGTTSVGIGTVQSIGTGLDLPKIAVSVVTTPIASNETTFRQARGRICRTAKGKDSAVMYYLMDPKFGKKHVRNLCKWSRKVHVMVNQTLVPGETWLRQ
jgi:superfamily II DNA or RNA helicase